MEYELDGDGNPIVWICEDKTNEEKIICATKDLAMKINKDRMIGKWAKEHPENFNMYSEKVAEADKEAYLCCIEHNEKLLNEK